MDAVAKDYASILRAEGYDSPRAIAATPVAELERKRIRPGHARAMHACAEDLGSDEGGASAGVKIFDYDTIVKSLSVADAIETVEDAFCKLAQDKVDVPMPMHITIDETATAGPGDCHVKGGYVSGAATWTVKVASVSFYKSGGPPGGGVFVVMNAVTGQPCGIFQENRFMTDLRTGASAASPRAVDACDIVDQRRRRGRHRAQALWQGRHDRLHRLRRHRPRHGARR